MRKYGISRRRVVKALGTIGVIGSVGGVAAAHSDDVDQKKIKELRKATSKYHDLDKAEEDGYVLAEECINHEDSPEADEGAMGFHATNSGLIDKNLVETEPEILVYEKKGNNHNLVAVEFASTHDPNGPAPSLFNHDFRPAPPSVPFNWALHVWAWKDNPNGLFADFNPRVSCP